MHNLLKIIGISVEQNGKSLAYGLALSVLVLLASFALLGLSGWFITATGIAGLAGIGIGFDVFRPSAAIRFLALGGAAARYGERLTTHNATLRSLATFRIRLLSALLKKNHEQTEKLRGSTALNRMTSDVDALDGVLLRLAIPFLAALIYYPIAFAALYWLSTPAIAISTITISLTGAALTLLLCPARSVGPAARAEQLLQTLRTQTLELQQTQIDLIVFGQLEARKAAISTTEAKLRTRQSRMASAERLAFTLIQLTALLTTTAVLAIGLQALQTGTLGIASLAFAIFASLTMAEVIHPLRKAVAEYGRMKFAADRMEDLFVKQQPNEMGDGLQPMPHTAPNTPLLSISDLTFSRVSSDYSLPVLQNISLEISAGERVALISPSGGGKSTLLHLIAGLLTPQAGTISLLGWPLASWTEDQLRRAVTMLPQRSFLLQGTVLETLQLGNPELTEAEAKHLISTVALEDVITRLGGLHGYIGEAGSNLSGGERRRLALARTLASKPLILLLDEPTEGLESDLSTKVLKGISSLLPDAAIIIASHRTTEKDWANRLILI